MKLYYCFFALALYAICGCKSAAQDDSLTISEFLLRQSKAIEVTAVPNDTIINNECVFVLPKRNNDTLISILREQMIKSNEQLYKYCEDNCEISTEYDVKSYVPSAFVSVLQSEYYNCSSMPSYSISSTTWNFVLYKGDIYKVEITSNTETNQYIDSLVKLKFESECIENGSLNDDLDLFISSGSFYINNPLHSKVCDEPMNIPVITDKLSFTKINR